ncbi:sulfatase [Haloferula sp. A504]|uniref:sulfatase n=1 Tax=Haloferula sp. A504 TaxID=3373601 RepID=UPI0031C551C2|nr:sulfatase-like hydrolase/transferase [Verrucomicrobiaceae bacterium E54]
MITATDHYIGEIVGKLDELGLRRNTVVIFMSDNGHSEETSLRIRRAGHSSGRMEGYFYGASGAGNTGKWIGHKGTFFEGGIRVPAIISYPGKLPSGEVRDQIMTAMDWYPTVLELCGIERTPGSPELDGHSLLPIVQSAEATCLYGEVLHLAWRQDWMVRDGEWKLIGKGARDGGESGVSLHRLTDAKPEVKDYSAEKPGLVTRLRVMHEAWLKEVTPQ